MPPNENVMLSWRRSRIVRIITDNNIQALFLHSFLMIPAIPVSFSLFISCASFTAFLGPLPSGCLHVPIILQSPTSYNFVPSEIKKAHNKWILQQARG
eukprot:g55397.t1